MTTDQNAGGRVWSRRRFLQQTLAAGAAATALPWLAACGGGAPAAPAGGGAAPAPAASPAGAAPAAPAAASPAAAAPGAASPAAAPAVASPAAASGAAGVMPKKGGTFNIAQDFGPQSLDPQKTNAWASTSIEELIFSGLTRWSKDMQVEPDMALSWDTPDPNTYIFKLRPNLKFQNGRDLSAEDVKYSFERIKDSATASPFVSQFEPLDKIEAVDKTTVKFTMKRPFAPFLRYVTTIPTGAIVPKEAADSLDVKPVGAGPFSFDEHARDQYVRLKRNANYYETDKPYVDTVVFKILGDDTSISAALRSGSVDIAWLKDPKVAANVAKSVEGLVSAPGVSSRYLPIDFKVSEPPFNDVRVRRAMSLALDRKAIVDTVLGGYGSVGTFLPPSQLAGYKGDGADLPYYKQDIAQAKKLLEEAGATGLKVPNFKVVAANALDVQCAQVMKEQWAQAGIDVTINPMEVGAILKDFAGGNYQMAVVGTVWAPDPDAESQRFNSKSPFGQNMGINDAKMDELIQKGQSELNDAERVKIYKEIEKLALDQVYIIVPYTYPLRWELTWKHVMGYDVMASNARLSVRNVWLNK